MEVLLNKLVRALPQGECYMEVGVLEGRTLEAASKYHDRPCYGFDPCKKYGLVPKEFGGNVTFIRKRWQDYDGDLPPVGVAFYDGDHSKKAVYEFLVGMKRRLASSAVVVLDDWDRTSVRQGVWPLLFRDYGIVGEMPEYTDGLTTAPHHFGYHFGVVVLGRWS